MKLTEAGGAGETEYFLPQEKKVGNGILKKGDALVHFPTQKNSSREWKLFFKKKIPFPVFFRLTPTPLEEDDSVHSWKEPSVLKGNGREIQKKRGFFSLLYGKCTVGEQLQVCGQSGSGVEITIQNLISLLKCAFLLSQHFLKKAFQKRNRFL